MARRARRYVNAIIEWRHPGSSALSASAAGSSRQIVTHASPAPAAWIVSASRGTSAFTFEAFSFTSMSGTARPRRYSSVSRSVGTRSPAKSSPNQRPASTSRSSAAVSRLTRPARSVVRPSLASWMTTTSSSFVR